MKYYARSPMALRRSNGVLEYWSVGKIFLKRFLSALLHYSTSPVLQRWRLQARNCSRGEYGSEEIIDLLPRGEKICSLG